ncbi:hypothetical protein A3A14_04210 [Candidatus Daviesbacteria bacterium RIFCSPLOWO2_01_FULL_43_38]|uniref:HNH endonuclease 5 domain-containing protein n=1 Tax=Candidatus Daviesbacteria bacterium RIFCSPHIGHO2_12_FULL_43_11 TaxID=1797780 RepID=A0A1F5K035_9BACT|nr:MAG: hypothetical protein A3E45_04550 [Candidatus Daviesbacteria bacterium RIFCSPHIGHO2_12_FULL_43_11]OGE63741.1 MAG: hypothetical protein A3A14_04210 [Candidatus Daviesbacteria bacterium RIFCSPLOWO2_01_FULL_43_38]
MKVNNICIFCKGIADTREHIPAKQFFKGVPDKPLITVPSCKNCNIGFQKDEDFFRQFNAGFLMDRSERAKELMENEITRSIQRKPALGHQMFNQMWLVDAYTKSGLYVGKMTGYKVSDLDRKRIDRIVTKIIQGLFYHEFKQHLPKDWKVRIVWIDPKKSKELSLEELAKTLKWNIIKDDTFAYGVNYVSETYQSMWIIDFFKVPCFYILLMDKEAKHNRVEYNRN